MTRGKIRVGAIGNPGITGAFTKFDALTRLLLAVR